MVTKYTTSNNTTLTGTQSADQLYGGNGVDDTAYSNVSLLGYGGADQLYAGNMTGSSATGAAGNDTLYGGGETNVFYGGNDADTFYGGGTENTYYGGAGDDIFDANVGNVSAFYGGAGTNTFYGGTSLSYTNEFYGGDNNATYYAEQAQSLKIDDNGTGGTVYFDHALSFYTRYVDTSTYEMTFTGLGQTVETLKVETFAFANGSGGYTTYTYDQLACFLAGTLIRTPDGEVAVEALQAGDLVMTTSGVAKPVLWVGRRAVETRHAHPLTDTPIRIQAHALGLNMPVRDLYVSPDHAFLIDGVLVQAGALVNGVTIARQRDLPETFTYFHVELEAHDFLYAEGLPAETYLDNGERAGFDNAAEFPGRARPAQEMDLPRVKSRRQLPKMLARALARRLFGGKGEVEQAS